MESVRSGLHANTTELFSGLKSKRAQSGGINKSNKNNDSKRWDRGRQVFTPYIKEEGLVENQVEAGADQVEVGHVEFEVDRFEVEVEAGQVEVEVGHIEVEVGHIEVEVEHIEVEVGQIEVG